MERIYKKDEIECIKFLRNLANLNLNDNGEGLKLYREKDVTHWINPKFKKDSKNSNYYCFNRLDFSELNLLLNQIYEKEQKLKNLGYDLGGIKSFNRNIWLDLSRESNAIEGIYDDFSYSLLDFRTKLNGKILKDLNIDVISTDSHDIYKELKAQLSRLKENNEYFIIEGKKHKHKLSFSTICHFMGFKYIYNCAKHNRNLKISPDEFLSIILESSSLLSNNDVVRFRKDPIYVFGANWVPVKAENVYDKLKTLGEWVTDDSQSGMLHPIEKAAIFHVEFIRIHPYADGNGRTGRIMSNYILIKNEIPSVSIKSHNSQEYFNAINKAVITHEIDDMIKIYYSAVYDSAVKIDECLDYIEQNTKPNEIITSPIKE